VPVTLRHGNILESSADALLLTVGEESERTGGSVAGQFARHHEEVWEDLLDALPSPMTVGTVHACQCPEHFDDCPFHTLVVGCLLYHQGVRAGGDKLALVAGILDRALRAAVAAGATTFASALLQGGWRLEPVLALEAMIAAYIGSARSGKRLDLEIWTRSEEEKPPLAAVMRRFGLR
jgi:hypothetical protein